MKDCESQFGAIVWGWGVGSGGAGVRGGGGRKECTYIHRKWDSLPTPQKKKKCHWGCQSLILDMQRDSNDKLLPQAVKEGGRLLI